MVQASQQSAADGAAFLRIVVHDYAGHPFQVQLSRGLASRGHEVLHLHFADCLTPKGPLSRRYGDPETLAIEGLTVGEPFQKYRYFRRLVQERRYGSVLARRIADYAPDVVISGNTPLDAQEAARAAAHLAGARFVFWIQDVYSAAVTRTLRRRVALVGPLLARRFTRLEQQTLRRSDAVVAITEDFVPILAGWGVDARRITVIENWAPLDGIHPLAKDNEWSRAHGLADKRVILYSGTLGLKHDPSVFIALAEGLSGHDDVRVVVISEGLGADWLRERSPDHPNLILLPFQSFERMSHVLATGDILLATLEPEAGMFSVPSKVLTYLAAGRPILAAMPAQNLAARIIERAGAGRLVSPSDARRLVEAAVVMLADEDVRRRWGESARAYACATFDVSRITDRFESVLGSGLAPVDPPTPKSVAGSQPGMQR